MKDYRKELWFNTSQRVEFINITPEVEKALRDSEIKQGFCLVNAMHITASVFINDNESGLLKDFKIWLEKLAPQKFDYYHHQTGEDNGYAHLWRTIMGREVTIAITNGNPDFGGWESIFYGEFDGRRRKRALVKVIGE